MSRTVIGRVSIAWLVTILSMLTLVACQPVALPQIFQPLPPPPIPTPTPTRTDETVIPFKTLAVNQMAAIPLSSGGEPVITTSDAPDPPELERLANQKPVVYLVTAPEEVAPFQRWLPPETLAALADVDYTQDVVLAFFPSWNSGGCDGYIQRIAASRNGALLVYGVMRTCSMTTADMKWPSHIIQVQRSTIPFPVTSGTQVTLETLIDRAYP